MGIKENPQMGRMDYLESVFLKLKLFFPVLVAKLISKFRISPGFLNQHSKKPFLPFFSEVAIFFQKLQI